MRDPKSTSCNVGDQTNQASIGSDATDTAAAVVAAYRKSLAEPVRPDFTPPAETLLVETIALERAAIERLDSSIPDWMKSALASTLPLIVLCAAFSIFNALSRPLAADTDIAASLVGLVVRPAIFFGIGICAASILVTWLLVHTVSSLTIADRHFVGALVAGVAFAVGGAAYVVRDVWNTKTTLAVTVSYTEDRLGELVLSSFRTREETGSFPVITKRFGPVHITTFESSRDRAIYVASSHGVPGVIVAHITPVSGQLVWSHGSHQRTRGSFLVATTVRDTGNRVELNDASGQTRQVTFAADLGRPLPGSRLAIALNSDGDIAEAVRVLPVSLK